MSRRGAMLLLRVSPHDTESCHAAKRPACPGRSSCREQISEPERTTKSRQSSALKLSRPAPTAATSSDRSVVIPTVLAHAGAALEGRL